MQSSRRPASDSFVPATRFAWLAGVLTTAAQPSRLAVGFVVALCLWIPGLAWDAAVGPRIDPPGMLAEPWDDVEQDDAQRTLRRIAAQLLPELTFEGARIPADDLAVALEARVQELRGDPEAARYEGAAARARSLAPLGTFEALASAHSAAVAAMVDGALALSPSQVSDGVRAVVWTIPVAAWARDPVFTGFYALWGALVCAVGLGALARMEATQIAGRTRVGAGEAFGFAADRWASLVLAWGGPLLVAALLGGVCVAFGALFRTSLFSGVAAVLYIVPLAIGAVAGLALLVGALGAPLAPAAVAADGLDAADASQRGAIYFLARPLLWILVAVATVGVVVVGTVLLRIVGWALTAFPAAMVSIGSAGRAPVESLAVSPAPWSIPHGGAANAIWWWVLLVGMLVFGASISLLGGALTRAYLLLRACCDDQPVDEVWPFELPADITDAPADAATPAAAPGSAAAP